MNDYVKSQRFIDHSESANAKASSESSRALSGKLHNQFFVF